MDANYLPFLYWGCFLFLISAIIFVGWLIPKINNKFVHHENTDKPKVVILDDNPLSMAKYAQEYPENFKEICDADHENTGVKN